MTNDRHMRAVWLLMATATLWSLGGVLIKGIALSGMAVSGFRSAIAFMVMLAFFGVRAINFSPLQLVGAAGYAATVTLFVCATKLTTAGNAILLQYTAPVYVAMLSGWFLREKIRWFDWAAMAVTLGGMCLFFLDRLSAGGMAGNILAITSGVSFAVMMVCMRKQKDATPAGSAISGNFLTAVICLPWMLEAAPGITDWAMLLFLGAFQLGLAYVCYLRWPSSMSQPWKAFSSSYSNPSSIPCGPICSWAKPSGPGALVGGLIVILSVAGRTGPELPAGTGMNPLIDYFR